MGIFKAFKKKDGEKQKTAPKEGVVALPKKDAAPGAKASGVTSRIGFVLKKPHISEKANDISATAGQYIFIVDARATKPMVRQAVQERYGVNVEGVNIIRKIGKTKRLGGRFLGRRSEVKKAIVFLKKGEKIDIT